VSAQAARLPVVTVLVAAVWATSARADPVRVFEATETIPSYEEGPPDVNPPFDLFASGRFNYPYTLRENLTDRRSDRVWRTLNLENEYLRVSVLPDLGGRLWRCVDKSNGISMFYANPTLKFAQVAYRGAWATFGIEFNFPVSHNWVTSSPVDFATERHPEGLFFPDTYLFARGSSDLAVLRRAYRVMQEHLAREWARRAPDAPYKTPYEALIMASIVEKETGRASEREQIAGVLVNRLRSGMLLQVDPSVIYGLGSQFDGNLRKNHLLTDGPYNTYTRAGLPPTPIAMPSLASIRAAVNPERTKALYFVARGDGSSVFSESLVEHNRAVNQYQRGGR